MAKNTQQQASPQPAANFSFKSFSDFQIIEPTLGQNSVGDLFFTDGKTYILNLKNGENI